MTLLDDTAVRPDTAAPRAPDDRTTTAPLFPVSARSREALRANARRLADWLESGGARVPLDDVGHTLARRRSHLTDRLVVRATDRADLVRQLRAAAAGREEPDTVSGSARSSAADGPVFVFSGHGSQWAGMGAELLRTEPVFAAAIAELEPVVQVEGGFSLTELLTGDGLEGAGMERVQPAVFATQVALARLWESYGIRPAAVIGHSMGEAAAAVTAGALSVADAARVICMRSRLMEMLAPGGATALVELAAEEAEDRLAGRAGIGVAVHASPRASVVAGHAEAVDAFVAECTAQGLLARRVPGVRIAAHSPQVDPVLGELTRSLGRMQGRTPSTTCYTTVLDDPRAQVPFDADYWAANFRRPVRFVQALRAALEDGHRIFVEVSPHPVVAQSVLETVSAVPETLVFGTLHRKESARTALLSAVARAHCAGLPVDWTRLRPDGRLADVPRYAWQHERFWPDERPSVPPQAAHAHPLLGPGIRLPGAPVRHVWQTELDTGRLPWIEDHQVHGVPVLPGTGYVEMALAAACEAFDAEPARVTVNDLDYHSLLPIGRPVTVTTTLTVTGEFEAELEIVTERDGRPVVQATARLTVASTSASGTSAPVAEPPRGRRVPATEVYERLRAMGQFHGPRFAALTDLTVEGNEALAAIKWPDQLPPHPLLRCHPALLDACLHGLAGLLPESGTGDLLPVGLDRFHLAGDPSTVRFSSARLRETEGGYTADVRILDADGATVAELEGLRLRPVSGDALPVPVDDLLHTVRWQPSAVPTAPVPTGRWLVTGTADAEDPIRTSLRERLDESTNGPVEGVLFLAWNDTAPADIPAAAEQRALAVAELAASMVRKREDGGAPPPRLIVVTRQGAHPDPVQGALRGLVRTLAMERPELGTRLIDLDPTTDPDGTADQLLAELGAPDTADETAWRGGTRHVASLQPLPSASGTFRPVVRPDGGYVITGGTRGVGLRTAQWLVERGARHLVLNSRSEPSPESAARIAGLRAAGAQVTLVQGDLARRGVARRLVDAVAAQDVRLRGVVHAATVLDDALITGMDAERFRRVWRAKATGAWHLHTATTDLDLDWWIAYSSLASLIGSAGQANYAAANAFVDSLTAHRRALGLPGLAVNWGAWAEVGRVRDIEFAGFDKLGPREAFAALEELLGADAGQAGVVRFRPTEFLSAHPHLRGTTFFTALASGEVGPDDGEFEVDGLARLDVAARREAVTARLALRTGQAMGLRNAASTVDRPLVALGLDSLAAVRIKALIHEDFGIDLPVTRLLEGASTADLAADLMAALDGPDPAGRTELRDTAVDQAVRRARQRAARTGRQQARRRKR